MKKLNAVLEQLKFDEQKLIPAIVQEAETGTVLMMAYMNEEALAKTLSTGLTWFYSRSRGKLWQKGETSGNIQKLQGVYYDCDGDTLLIKVRQQGPACHTGNKSCFYRSIFKEQEDTADTDRFYKVIDEVWGVIQQRKKELPEGSYTTSLFQKGQDKILQKCLEEMGEVMLASKELNREKIIYELADLIYHLLVLLVLHEVSSKELGEELSRRR